jgi:hypothetical protein
MAAPLSPAYGDDLTPVADDRVSIEPMFDGCEQTLTDVPAKAPTAVLVEFVDRGPSGPMLDAEAHEPFDHDRRYGPLLCPAGRMCAQRKVRAPPT